LRVRFPPVANLLGAVAMMIIVEETRTGWTARWNDHGRILIETKSFASEHEAIGVLMMLISQRPNLWHLIKPSISICNEEDLPVMDSVL
jgi:hypothetical protein